MRIFISIVSAIFVVTLIWGLWAIYSVEIAYWALGNTFIPAQAGPWGDSFGPFSAFFGALGFAAVLITIWSQQKQIRDAQKDQHRQRFESSFFELLRFFREARAAVRFRHSDEYYNARNVTMMRRNTTHEAEEAFRAGMGEIRYWCRNTMVSEEKAALVKIYLHSFHSRYESKLGPYYRLLYTILEKISSDTVLSKAEKASYGNLIRSQLTSHEAAMAGLNGLAPFAKDFSRLVEEFRLLKYVNSNTVLNILKKHYHEDAFRSRN